MLHVAEQHFLPQRPSALRLARHWQYRGATLLMMALGKFLPGPLAQPWVAKELYERQSSLYAGLTFSARLS